MSFSRCARRIVRPLIRVHTRVYPREPYTSAIMTFRDSPRAAFEASVHGYEMQYVHFGVVMV